MHCTDLKCPYRHQDKTGGKEYRQGDTAMAKVQMWRWLEDKNEGYGFLKTSEGTELFVHSSSFQFDGRDLLPEAMVKFNVKKDTRQGRNNQAINVVLN